MLIVLYAYFIAALYLVISNAIEFYYVKVYSNLKAATSLQIDIIIMIIPAIVFKRYISSRDINKGYQHRS